MERQFVIREIADKEKNMDKLIDLQAILFRTQNANGERLRALATLETLEAERNRRLARRPALTM